MGLLVGREATTEGPQEAAVCRGENCFISSDAEVCICQNSQNCVLNKVNFIELELYLSTPDFED